MKSTALIMDVDAGVDDTLAVIFALLTPSLRVRAITAVAGNVPVHLCTQNVLLTLEMLDGLIAEALPVAKGASRPLRRALFTAREVHGEDGIGNASAFYDPPRRRAAPEPAADLILRMLRGRERLSIVATGPLTNIAAAYKKDPAAMRRVKEIIVMGGAFEGVWNTGPVAEFNFYVDPEAADCVMRSGLPVTLIPLNVTHRCILSPGDLRNVFPIALRRYVQRVTTFYFDFHRRTAGFTGGYLHDPLAVAAVAHPSFFSYRTGYVRVEGEGKYTRGLSVFIPRLDLRKNAEMPGWVRRTLRNAPSVRVATGINAASFKREFLAALRKP